MAQLGFKYDPTEHETGDGSVGGGGPPVEPGTYELAVIDSDLVPNSKGTGDVLKLTYEIQDGPHKGHKVYDNLSIRHATSETAERIALETLGKLCRAIGLVDGIEDSQDLHLQPFTADLGIDPERTVNGKTYSERNKITRFHFADGTIEPQRKPAAAAKPAPRPAQAAPAAGGRRPWDKKSA